MRTTKAIAAAAALLITALACAPALAHHPRARLSLGLHFGVPVYAPAYYPYYYYPPYYAPTVVYRAAPEPLYIEQGQEPATASPAPANYWHYCNEARGYYPYVKECPGGWQRVSPQPRN